MLGRGAGISVAWPQFPCSADRKNRLQHGYGALSRVTNKLSWPRSPGNGLMRRLVSHASKNEYGPSDAGGPSQHAAGSWHGGFRDLARYCRDHDIKMLHICNDKRMHLEPAAVAGLDQ
jgi:hypothetical protein